MRIDLCDGRCRSCQGPLVIIHADELTMTVECELCADLYLVEPDAFADGALDYHAAYMTGEEPLRPEGGR